MADRIRVSRSVAASADDVYAAISDVTRMGEWSEEFSRKISGVDDRAARNRQTMTSTLDRLAAALEH